MTSPAPELVAAARDGDQRALDALVSAAMPLVYNLAGRALRGHADVDDVVQETMLRVVRGIGELEKPESFRSWLVAITLHQVRDQGRRRSTAEARMANEDQTREYADLGSDFAGVTILRLGLTEQRRGVAEATRWLDPEDRELLSLWWLEESGHLDRHELARALGVSTTHAAVRVHRLKRRLDAARVIVQALQDAGRCPELRFVADEWDGTPNPLWRKRFDRHIRNCEVCQPRDRTLVPVARLLRGMPLVPVPFALRTAVAAHIGAGGGAAVQASGASTAGHAARVIGRGARRGLRHARPRSFMLSPPMAVTSVGVATAAVAAYVVLPGGHPATTPVAQVSRPSVSATIATPLRISASPSRPATSAAPPPSTKAAVVASPTPTPPTTPTATSSSRKGVGAWTFSGQDTALAESGASWYYTWATDDKGISASHVGFVPMIWGSASVTASSLAQAKANTSCGCVLGFNEPDNGGQSNMTPSQALALWPQLMNTGLELGSPAVAGGGATPGGWLDQFMTGANQKGYRVNFITLHWYGSDFTTSDAVSQLKSYIVDVYNRYHLPIWLTEFALISFANGGEQFPSETQQAAFLTGATQMLDSLPYVQRYAWFGLPADSALPNSGLFQPGPVITPVGTAFEAAR
jgi:RNA polymerase sigma factor (sigma-70 family)